MKLFMLFTILFYIMIISCNNHNERLEIIGNWSVYSSDNDYSEFYFNDSILEAFNKEWLLYPSYKYSLINDTLKIGEMIYKVKITHENSFELIGGERTYYLEKINPNEFTLENLVKEGLVFRNGHFEIDEKFLIKYVDSNFTVRNTRTLISRNIVNKDSLLIHWKSQLQEDSIENDYLKFLIEKFENN